MSPTLFTITFNELLKQLREAGIYALAFADDLVVVGRGQGELQEAIGIIER